MKHRKAILMRAFFNNAVKNMRQYLFILMFLLSVMRCSSIPAHLAVPYDDESSIIGVRVKHRAPLRIFQQYAQRVYFIKIDDEDSILMADRVYEANYTRFSHAYLMNVQPGTYAIVATAYKKTSSENLKVEYPKPVGGPPEKPVQKHVEWIYTIFNEDLIRATITTVRPGSIEFIGDLCVDQDIFLFNIMKTDKYQLHFTRLVRPPIDGLCFYSGKKHTIDRERATELKFMRKASVNLKNTAWEQLCGKRIEKLFKEN